MLVTLAQLIAAPFLVSRVLCRTPVAPWVEKHGLAGAIALTFLSSRAAMPAAVTTAFAILNFIWLTF